MRKGSAKHLDHAQLVHAQWMVVAAENIELFVKRVAIYDIIADLTSRMLIHALMYCLRWCDFPFVFT